MVTVGSITPEGIVYNEFDTGTRWYANDYLNIYNDSNEVVVTFAPLAWSFVTSEAYQYTEKVDA